MLNVGPLELLVVLAVALIVVGPERLPELARSVGRALRQFRDVQDEVRELVSAGVDDDMRDAASELRKATGDLRRATDVKGAVRSAQRSIHREVGPTSRPTPSRGRAATAADGGETGEAGGAPAERLVEDNADAEASAPPSPETEVPTAADADPSPAPDAEPDASTDR